MKKLLSRSLPIAIAFLTALGFSSCQTARTTHRSSFTFDPPAQQPKNRGNVRLKLSTGAQRLYVL